ncbi:MAG: gluconokinase [Halioglobus sp.]|nr:gluconokinase [Halioglobus sp.]
MKLVVCGVSGAGKSTVGRLLATRLEVPFFDADDYHPLANIQKMRSGTPLTDEDRIPWLRRLASLIEQQNSLVLACSALKQSHREILGIDQANVFAVFLQGSREVIAARMAERNHEFMPAALLESQFEALEPPVDCVSVCIDQSPGEICAEILDQLPRSGASAISSYAAPDTPSKTR